MQETVNVNFLSVRKGSYLSRYSPRNLTSIPRCPFDSGNHWDPPGYMMRSYPLVGATQRLGVKGIRPSRLCHKVQSESSSHSVVLGPTLRGLKFPFPHPQCQGLPGHL